MNEFEFFKEFKELCEYFNSKIYENRKITRTYFTKVKNLTIEEFKIKCVEIISRFKFMPKVADFDVNTRYLNFEQRKYTKAYLESFYDVGGD